MPSHRTRFIAVSLLVGSCLVNPVHAATDCRSVPFALSDAQDIAAVRGAIARQCPCDAYDGSSAATTHSRFVACAQAVIDDAADGSPLLGGFTLRRECRAEVRMVYKRAACGYPATAPRVMCCEARLSTFRMKARAKRVTSCTDSPSGQVVRHACYVSPFAPDACSFTFLDMNGCTSLVTQETVDLPSGAEPAETPGSPGVVVTNPKLLAQFGGAFSLNNVRYTRHRLAGPAQQPEAILILVPGFEGGAHNFKILAENIITRAQAEGLVLEVWAYDRRTNQLEDTVGLDIAEEFLHPGIGLDWLYGGELGLTLHPLLAAGPNRRAVFYDTQADVPFIANWTSLVFSRDIDVLVAAASNAAMNQNVFLGGHSAGTGFTARYASTDFDLTGGGPAEPGYTKLRGLVLLEGAGGSTGGAALTADTLDRIEAKFDGGLFGAVRDNAPRCADGTTPCTVANEAVDCAALTPPLTQKCTLPTTSYAIVPGLLNARVTASGEVVAIQAALDPNGGENILRVDQGAPGNNAVDQVPDLGGLALLPRATAEGGLGLFLDDDGLVASLAPFLSTSLGGPGPVVGGLQTWRPITDGVDSSLVPNNGPPPTTLPGAPWGQEQELTRFDRMGANFYRGRSNFTDVYYPSSGLSVTSVTGVCSSGTCSVGNVGASCSTNAQCSQAISLDSSALSIGRGRRDIENLTQAPNVDIPVIAFGGSNGLATVPGVFTAFGASIATCSAPSCDGTPRVIDASIPNPAFPTFGDIPGGYEVVMAEGFTHLDVLTSEDVASNPVPSALVAFLKRNVQ